MRSHPTIITTTLVTCKSLCKFQLKRNVCENVSLFMVLAMIQYLRLKRNIFPIIICKKQHDSIPMYDLGKKDRIMACQFLIVTLMIFIGQLTRVKKKTV